MTTQLITASYNDAITINFTSDAWFNATAVAKHFNKRSNDWLSLESTKEYISKLMEFQLPEKTVNEKTQLVRAKTGSIENGGGSWFHPKLAIAFARWLDVGFSIWCDMQIEKILHPVIESIHATPEPKTKSALAGCLTLEQQDVIKAMVKSRAEELPQADRAGATIKMWSSVKKKYGCTYKAISTEHFTAVCSLIARLPLQGESITEALPPPSAPQIPIEGTVLMRVDRGQIINCEVLPQGAVMFDPRGNISVTKLVMDYIPAQQLGTLIESASRRLDSIAMGKTG